MSFRFRHTRPAGPSLFASSSDGDDFGEDESVPPSTGTQARIKCSPRQASCTANQCLHSQGLFSNYNQSRGMSEVGKSNVMCAHLHVAS